jgi:BirA family biotin operon repressor/biotin-[acetyl-CoA-carboxylase] ligase
VTSQDLEQLIVHHDTVDSTQMVVRRAVSGDPNLARGWTAVARHQTAGRGRWGRHWRDAGDALLWSTWFPAGTCAAHLPLLSIAAGIALADAVEPHVQPALKWPNDLLAPDGRKLAGILVESHAGDGTPLGAIVGVGLNLSWPPEGPPDELRGRAAALAEWSLEAPADAAQLLIRWLTAMLRWETDLRQGRTSTLPEAFSARLSPQARRVRWKAVDGGECVGYIEGIDQRGYVTIRGQNGERVTTGVGELDLADQPA